MSYEAPGWAVVQRTGSPTLKMVLMVLAGYADEYGFCFPKVSTIADRAEVSPDTARRSLIELAERGLIRIQKRFWPSGAQTSNGYWLAMPGVQAAPPEWGDPSAKGPPKEGVAKCEGGTRNLQGGDSHSSATPITTRGTIPSLNEKAGDTRSSRKSADKPPAQEGTAEWYREEVWSRIGPIFKERFYPTVSGAQFKSRLGATLKLSDHDLRRMREAMLSALKAEPGGDAWEYVVGILRRKAEEPPKSRLIGSI